MSKHPKLSLSTDFGSKGHWRRLVDYAAANHVDRLVFWGDYTNSAFTPPYLYPEFPGLIPEPSRERTVKITDRYQDAGKMCADAGIEFWYAFQVLEIPSDLEHVRRIIPALFNKNGEVDAGSPLIHDLIEAQLRELVALSPNLDGVEVWMMECATVTLSKLENQRLSLDEIYKNIINSLSKSCRKLNLKLAIEIHSAGGENLPMEAITRHIKNYPEIIFSCDNTFGDYHLMMPVNPFIKTISGSNPIQCNFDVYGEYWGRNLVPTSALEQYETHLREVLKLNPLYINGRVSTGHDLWSCHRNVLPSRQNLFPEFHNLKQGQLPKTFPEIAAFDTLGTFNIKFLLEYTRSPSTTTRKSVLTRFIANEFGGDIGKLSDIFGKIEKLNRKLFYTDSNRYGFQSAFWKPDLVEFGQLPYHLTRKPGESFAPSQEKFLRPHGLTCIGVEAMIAEKIEAVEMTEKMLDDLTQTENSLSTEANNFLREQFENLHLFALAARWLLETQAHFYLWKSNVRHGKFPNKKQFTKALCETRRIATQWRKRYPSENFGNPENHWEARYAPNNYGLPDGLKKCVDYYENKWNNTK